MERRLLSDIDGKIKHILTTFCNPLDFADLLQIRHAFDADVHMTVLYDDSLEIEAPRHVLEGWQRPMSFYPVESILPMFVQDRLHVLEGKKVMSSLSPEENAKRLAGTDKSRVEKTDVIFDTPFWKEHGFEVVPNDLGVSKVDGGDVIVTEDHVFVGGDVSVEYVYNELKQMPTIDFIRGAQHCLEEKLKRLDGTRKIIFVDANGYQIRYHIDVYFTPLMGNMVGIQMPGMTRERLRIPENFVQREEHFPDNYTVGLMDLAGWMQDLGFEVMPMAGLPALKHMDGEDPIQSQLVSCMGGMGIHFSDYAISMMSFNNVLQETVDGKRRVYVPRYALQEQALKIPELYDRLMRLNDAAAEFYEGMGFEVKQVPIGFRPYLIGSLRCSVKVLERE